MVALRLSITADRRAKASWDRGGNAGAGAVMGLFVNGVGIFQDRVHRLPLAVFQDTKKAAKEAGFEVKVGKFPFSASGKASAAGAKDGFVKMIYDAKYGELLGAHMIGANVTEMIAEIVVARKLETTGMELLKAVHPHPTMSEAVMEATAAAYGEVIHL